MPIRHTTVAFFGLGSQTAAPLMYTYLKEHPQAIILSEPTGFFSDTTVHAKGINWYERQFQTTKKTGALCGELTFDYLTSAQAAGLIARTYPNAKLLAVIENPLVSVRVEYVEARRNGTITPQTSLTEFLRRHPEVLLRARYGHQLVPYFSYYAPTDLLVLVAMDVRADVLRAVKMTYEHVGLDPKFVPVSLRHLVVEEEDEKKKPGLIKRSISAVRGVVKMVYRYINTRLRPREIKTETSTELALKIPIEPALEAKLKAYFSPDVAKLSSLLHRNLLVEWGFEGVTE